MSLLRSSVSGLQQLLSSASSSLSTNTARGQRQLESVTEEAHTHDLLYPEGEILYKGQHHAYPLRHGDPVLIAAAANSSDDRGGLDIQSPRDVRIIIAQDANAHCSQPRVLYDSSPPLPLQQARNDSPEAFQYGRPRGESMSGGGPRRNNSMQKSHTAPHTRQSSLSQTAQSLFLSASPLSPVNELGGLFGNTKGRNFTERPVTSDGDNLQYRIAKEAREETEIILECMFGAAGFPSVASTKLHVRPPKSESASIQRPTSAREPTSPGPSPRRRTPLTRSTTAADLQTLSTTREDVHQQASRPNSSSILVTRLFSVEPIDPDFSPQLRSKEFGSPAGSQQNDPDDVEIASKQPISAKMEKKKQIKTPTYAIAILLQMPAQRQRPSTPRFPGYSAVNPQSWYQDSNPLGADSNGDIDYVIKHWNMLNRTLSCLEVIARCKISDSLSMIDVPQMDFASRVPPTGSTATGPTEKPKKPKQTQITLHLPAGALQQCLPIKDFADQTGRRIALALKIRRAVSGQARWGLWREEARWVGKWAGGRDQNFFLFNLLTAFLGSHTEWLDLLRPSRYRRRHGRHSPSSRKETTTIPHRTVIVSLDKMAARRLIFLLSAFLPGTPLDLSHEGPQQAIGSWPRGGYSDSPPLSMLIGREHLSERKPYQLALREDRPAKPPRSHSRAVSFPDSEFASDSTVIPGEATVISDGRAIRQHTRRTSDTRSVRSVRGAALPISFNGAGTRKSSTTTTATMVPELAYFRGTAPEPRPGSSGSLVPLSLKRTLSRSDSNDQNASIDSQSLSRTGSWLSGFWSNRRGSSTEDSDLLASSEEGLGISGVPKDSRSQRSGTTLSQMVKEVDSNGKGQCLSTGALILGPTRQFQRHDSASTNGSPPKNVSEQPLPEVFPLKLSIDEDDGIIDVDLPPTSYPSSFESAMSSPIALHSAASSFNKSSSLYSRASSRPSRHANSETSVDVAGWLRTYHQDFALQAVRPYDSLKEDIKQSMRTEPTPAFATNTNTETDGWTDVCTTLVANTSKFTVTRLTLRRRNATFPHHQAHALLGDMPVNLAEQEQFVEEQLMDIDPTLSDAVEKVLAQSGQSSRVASRTPSRAPSPTRSIKNVRGDITPRNDNPGLEIPHSECQRMVLGALQQVVKSVSEELANGNENRRGNLPADNALREGVRRCLCEVYK